MRKERKIDLRPMLKPQSVAVIGASNNPDKVGHIILNNYLEEGYQGRLYPINPNDEMVMGIRAYKSVLGIRDKIDLAVIAVPAAIVPMVLEECGRAKVKSVVVVSGGFAEVGETKLQDKIVAIANKYNISMVGPNCLGVMDPRSRVDTLFLPTYKLTKPKVGGVSFVAQSGAVGSTVLDLIAGEGFGLSKFISYGNAAQVDEVDILKYLMNDDETKVIIMYIEGVKRGREFLEVAKKVTRVKPVVVIKGGTTDAGVAAARSHTAALAGSNQSYEAVFKQCGFSIAKDLDELLYFGKAFASEMLPLGDRVVIITNGGGTGVLTTDAVYNSGLRMAELSARSRAELSRSMPSTVNVRNPLDLVGDAGIERYDKALSVLSEDPGIDMIIVIALFQTPGADEGLALRLAQYKKAIKKPMIVISIGDKYTRDRVVLMENEGLPVYDSPSAAANSLAELLKYYKYKKGIV
ncbi:MAG: CoA-binding protein [Candidatus Micrarchaeota archaeon]|nr:CoA-binding protein [Candidatus Micrarchaeota archaeon]MDE1847469.1 CoA-binding protein [Candidatus Micrarchaeota archaeon]MDE1864036.1 CoA-binding protein [Candidatus Micrarchaeota archaeon]